MSVLVRRSLRPFHYGTVRGVRPLGLWISSGYDLTAKRPFLNVTIFGHYCGRVYAKELRRS